MPKAITRFVQDQRGAAAVEYSIVVAAIAVGLFSVISELSGTLRQIYETISSGVASIAGGLSG